LTEALDMAVDHLSLYQLTIEAGTRFADLYRLGKLQTPTDDAAALMYDITQDVCETAGMPAYEVSNHARPGSESRHNQIYWRYGDYVGVGPGAHGRLTLGDRRVATETILAPEAWLEAADEDGIGSAVETTIAPEDQATEYLLMCLRLSEGADLARFESLGGAPLDPVRIAGLIEDGMLTQSGTRLTATAQGRIVLNAVLGALLS
jgi:oxygen-independent coproporphyrinogen-3 oxidase